MSAEAVKPSGDELLPSTMKAGNPIDSAPLEAPDEFPAEWKIEPASKHLLISDYGLSLKGQPTGRYPILRMNCQVEGRVVFDNLQFVDLDEKTSRQFRVMPGDVLFNRTNSIEHVGRTALYESEREAVFASYLIRLRFNTSEVCPRYINYYLNAPDTQAELKTLASRAVGQANISASKLTGFNLVLPPKPEQEKIAAVLWRVQQAVQLECQLVRVARELKAATLRHLFTHGLLGEPTKETELGLLPESWRPVCIGGLGEVVTGTTPKTAQPEYYVGGTIDFIAPGDLGDATQVTRVAKKITKAGLAVCRALPKDTSLFVCIGSTIGKVGITTNGPCATNQQINAVIAGPHFDPHFICYLLERHAEHIASRSSPSPVPIVSKAVFSSVQLYASPDKDEQREIARHLAAVDAKISLHERNRDTLRALFRTLLRDLLTARRRVHDLPIDVSEVTAA